MSLENQIDNNKYECIVNDINSVTKVLDIKVSKENFNNVYQNVLNDTISKVKINGFRPGKAPRKIVESMYQNAIFLDVKDKLVRESISNCARDKKLDIYQVKDVNFNDNNVNFDNDMSFKVTVEVFPTIPDVPNYDGVSVTAEKDEFTDEILNQSIENVTKQFSTPTIIKDRKPQGDDKIKFSLEVSYEDGKTEEKREYYRLLNDSSWNVENSASFDPAIKEALSDMNIDETRELKSTIKIINQNGEFEPGAVTYKVSLMEIAANKPLELTDDFVKTLPGFGASSVSDLKELFTKAIKEQITNANKEREKDAVVTELLKSFDFEIPEAMIFDEIQNMLSSQANGYIKNIDLSKASADVKEHIVNAYTPIAKQRIQVMYLIDAVIKKENITVSEEEYKDFIAKIEATEGPLPHNIDKARLRIAITREIQRTKAWDLLCEKANITYVPLGELNKNQDTQANAESSKKTSRKTAKKEAKSGAESEVVNGNENVASEASSADAPKKTRAKKACASKESNEEACNVTTEEAPKAKRGRKKKEEA